MSTSYQFRAKKMTNEEKAQEYLSDVTGSGESNCCGGRVYSPTKAWAKCLSCYEYCDIVPVEVWGISGREEVLATNEVEKEQ